MRKNTKKILATVLSMALTVTAFSTMPEAKAASKVKKITLSAKKKTLTVGSKFTLKVKKVKPAKATKKVTWKSSKKSVATVSKKGVVTAKKAGKATITATAKGNKKAKATCKITVKAAKKKATPTPQNTNQTPSPAPSGTPALSGSPEPSDTPAPSKTPKPTRTPKPTLPPDPTPGGPLLSPNPEPDYMKLHADFNVGTVVNYEKTQNEAFTELAKNHFDIVSFENEMKGYSLHDKAASKEAAEAAGGEVLPVCNFEQADEMVEWAIANGLKVRGHVLIWEASMHEEFFHVGYDKEAALVDKDTLLKRMESYAMQVVTHFETKYPGTVIAWDVVNEAINDSGKAEPTTGLHLNTGGNFYKIIGPDYIKYAFQYAKKAVAATGKEILLYYNDFNCFSGKKTDYILDLIDYLNADPNNKLLDCMGMEGYVLTYWPDPTEVSLAMYRFVQRGVKLGINELTVRLNPDQAADKKEVKDSDIENHAKKYKDMFTEYCKFDKANPGKLTNVSIWGLLDRPDLMEDRENYDYSIYGTHSGLFDENLKPKKAFQNVMEVLKEFERWP